MITAFTRSPRMVTRLVLILCIGTYVPVVRVLATTVIPTLQDCPFCQKQFVRSSIGSWFQGREPDRDFGGSMQAASLRVVTCPHCLFSAIPSEFRFTDAGDSNAVRKALAELRQRIRTLPETLRAKALQNADYWGLELLQYRIAEVCDTVRQPDAIRTATLHHSAYLRLKYIDDAAVVAEERQQAIRAFEAAAQTAKPRRPKDLHWTYLAGELRRCAGDTNGAVAHLDEAVRLAGPAGTQHEAGSLGRWAAEQADKARRGDTNDSPRMPVYGPEREEQRRILHRRLPEMVVALNSGKPPAHWLLEGEDRLKTVWVVSDLAEEGNQDAAAFLFGWLARLEDSDLVSRSYQVCRAARILSRQPMTTRDDALARTKFRVESLGDVARYAVRGGPLPDSLRSSLQSKGGLSVPAQAGISAASGRRDKTMKPLLRARMEGSEDYVLTDGVRDYFGVVGGPADILLLDGFAAKFGKKVTDGQLDWTAFRRGDIEDTIRLIRIREIFGQ